MAFSTRLNSRKLGLLGSSCWFKSTFSVAHIHPMSTATVPTEFAISPSKTQNNSSSYSPPWMMLPPTFNDNNSSSFSYNFYSLAENRVLTRPQKELTNLMPIRDLKLCGSSHGWLAMFNPHSHDLFLYNPISLRHIKLPPIHNFPNFPNNTKVILSCSPDEDDHSCRAVVNYKGALAFCCPGRSKEWTPIGKTAYEDIVYSSRQNLFFVLDQDCHMETWDLSEPSSPRMVKTDEGNLWDLDDDNMGFKDTLDGLGKYLVVADELCSHDKDDVLLVSRYTLGTGCYDDDDLPLGSRYLIFEDDPLCAPSKRPSKRHTTTTCFDIDIYDQEEGRFKGLVYDQEEGRNKGIVYEYGWQSMGFVHSLGDFALFVGCHSDSVALSVSQFPEVKPNSIYFPDAYEPRYRCSDTSFCGYDFGIFNHGNKGVSPCYYPNDLQRLKGVVPSTMWFFPGGYA